MSDYWKKHFNSIEIANREHDYQKNVERTKHGVPISEDQWNQTIRHIQQLIELNENDSIVELGCGNGMVSGELAQSCKEVTGVDFSKALLEQFKQKYGKSQDNISLILNDVTEVQFNDAQFDKCITYALLQHLTEKESFELIEKCLKWVRPKGLLFMGDVPDIERKWEYINKPEYHIDYFNRLKMGTPMIGSWFSKNFFMALPSYFENTEVTILQQPFYQNNADHRFDVLIKVLDK